MRLQTDPTVIYGLGAKFDGNLQKTSVHDPISDETRDFAAALAAAAAFPGLRRPRFPPISSQRKIL